MYRQTYQILQYLVLSNHPFLGFSFLIGTSNMRYRLFILSFITCAYYQLAQDRDHNAALNMLSEALRLIRLRDQVVIGIGSDEDVNLAVDAG